MDTTVQDYTTVMMMMMMMMPINRKPHMALPTCQVTCIERLTPTATFQPLHHLSAQSQLSSAGDENLLQYLNSFELCAHYYIMLVKPMILLHDF